MRFFPRTFELELLTSSVVELSKTNTAISKSPLPYPDLKLPFIKKDKFTTYSNFYDEGSSFYNYSDEALSEFVRHFYIDSFSSYRNIVELNFTDLIHKLDLLKQLPYKIYVEVNRREERGWDLKYVYQKEGLGFDDVTIKVDPAESRILGLSFIDSEGKKVDFCKVGLAGLTDLLSPFGGPGFNQEKSNVSRQMPIRTFVYKLIENDFKNITADDLLTTMELRKSSLIKDSTTLYDEVFKNDPGSRDNYLTGSHHGDSILLDQHKASLVDSSVEKNWWEKWSYLVLFFITISVAIFLGLLNYYK